VSELPCNKRPKFRWRRRFLVAVVVLVGAAILHVPLLRIAAGFLVADERNEDGQYVGLLIGNYGPDGDGCFDEVAKLCRGKPSCGVVVIEPRKTRLVEMGVIPSLTKLSRRELESRGLSPHAIARIVSNGRDAWATAHALNAWLAEHAEGSMTLLCSRFHSAHLRYVLNAVLDPVQAARVRVCGLADRRFDETNWWLTRDGIKAFGDGWLRQFHSWCIGESCNPSPICSANDFEGVVRRSLSQESP
jgi:hypothetical protein